MGLVKINFNQIIALIFLKFFIFRPSVWPNMMHLIIFGLENLNDAKTSALALKWANRWVRSNYIAYVETGGMYEKYKATEFGAIGGGEKSLSR